MATALESAQLYAIANQALEHWLLQVTSLTLLSGENTVCAKPQNKAPSRCVCIALVPFAARVGVRADMDACARRWWRCYTQSRADQARWYYHEPALGTPTTTRQAGLIQCCPVWPCLKLCDQPSDSRSHVSFTLGALIARATWQPSPGQRLLTLLAMP